MKEANAARLAKQLTVEVELASGEIVSIKDGVESGKLSTLYYRPFQTKPDTYGISEPGETGFFKVTKMVYDHFAAEGMPSNRWGA